MREKTKKRKNYEKICLISILAYCLILGQGFSQEENEEGEVILRNEGKLISDLEKMLKESIKEKYPNGRMLRDAHPKDHGCYKAKFTVPADLDDSLKVGMFKNPKSYEAWVRFSNGSSTIQSDDKPDTRGIAIKVMGVDGEKILPEEKNAKTQDFLMVSHPVFVAKDIKAFHELVSSTKKYGVQMGILWYFFPSTLKPWKWKLNELKIFYKIMKKPLISMLQNEYFSMVPFRFGNRQIKYMAIPENEEPNPPVVKGSLKDEIVKRLNEGPVVYDFGVQFRQGESIEDATQWWNGEFVRLAKLEIMEMKGEYKEVSPNFCDNLSFTPLAFST